jgi:hypothetical protein
MQARKNLLHRDIRARLERITLEQLLEEKSQIRSEKFQISQIRDSYPMN